jgi:hypothetical protein
MTGQAVGLQGGLALLRHKLLKASNVAGFKRRGDGRFCWNSAHKLGLRLVCYAVVLIRPTRSMAA